jgi:hypothetical protein
VERPLLEDDFRCPPVDLSGRALEIRFISWNVACKVEVYGIYI